MNYPWLEEYMLAKPGASKDYKAEWDWHLYLVGGKMFASVFRPPEKYDPAYAGKDLISLKCDPMMAEFLREQHPEVIPGFYCDKRHWNSVDLGGSLPDDALRQMIDDSYRLVFEKLIKKLQKEILDAAD